MKKTWVCIEVACDAALTDDMAAQTAEAFGVGVEITGTGFRFYLQGDRFLPVWEAKLETLRQTFQNSPNAPLAFTWSHSPLEEEDWADHWKRYFKPLRVGRHFVVCPTWEKVGAGERDRIIWIDPGQAFGTGHHESTRLCLEWLEEQVLARQNPNPCSVLDVGTGSGILAIGAALLGCRPVCGLDVDAEALQVAAENVALNQVADTVSLRPGSAADVSERFEIVLANIQALPLVDMAGVLSRRLEPSGRLGLSGILLEQKEMVQGAYAAQGLTSVRVNTAGEWCLLDFAKQ